MMRQSSATTTTTTTAMTLRGPCGFVAALAAIALLHAQSVSTASPTDGSFDEPCKKQPPQNWSNESQQFKFIRRCIALAKEAVASGGGAYGALIADPNTGMIVVEGRNHASQNSIWHGEMDAITQLAEHLNGTGNCTVYDVAPGLELYTSAEPCPMCAGAISWSQFGRVVFGTNISYIKSQGQNQILVSAETIVAAAAFTKTQVVGGVLANESDPLYRKPTSQGHSHDHREMLQQKTVISGGNHVISPPYSIDPNLLPKGNPRGSFFNFTMTTASSRVFDGTDKTLEREACHGVRPGECCHKGCIPTCAINWERSISVYVPHQYIDGDDAPILIMQDGPGNLDLVSYALDNLGGADNGFRPFVAISIENGGCDAIKSERGLEYDTMSERYARFVNEEVIPAVQMNKQLRQKYPKFAITSDPDLRGAFGCSSGGAAALSMAWFRPDLFRRVAAYSGTFVDQQDHDDMSGARASFPFGAWEYHSASQLLLKTQPRKPLRIFHHCSEFDLGYNTSVTPVNVVGNLNVNNTAGDVAHAWTDGHHNWRVAGNRTAEALAAAGYTYRHVFSVATHHCDPAAIRQTLADTLVWLWQDN